MLGEHTAGKPALSHISLKANKLKQKLPFRSGRRALAVATLAAAPLLALAQTTPESAAARALQTRAAALGLRDADVQQPAITSEVADAGTGVHHYYLRQRLLGVEIHGAVADVHLDRAGKLVALHQSFVKDAAAAAGGASAQPVLSAAAAVAAAARALALPAPTGLRADAPTDPAAGILFNKAGISLEKIPVRLLWQSLPDGRLRLAWDVTIAPLDGLHYWNVRVDAASGQLLDQLDYGVSEAVTFAQQGSQRPVAVATTAPAPVAGRGTASGIPNSYNVWATPVESPNHGARSIAASPADAVASPFGWHDTDGVTGPEYTYTRGNNVLAYDDRRNINGFVANSSVAPDGGPTLDFDFPFSPTATWRSNQQAAVVNLFYWNNRLHDVMARKGFDEASGNFQYRNYGGTGLGFGFGFDYVQAEAQDGAGLNNANFQTPPDGSRPRMQMYLWSGNTGLVVNAPATLAGPIAAQPAAFGPDLSDTGTITGNLVLVNDGSGRPSRGCGNGLLLNAAAINSNIALIDRGKCPFTDKVRNAQTAGARLAIVIDSLATGPLVTMGGTDTVGIRIPSLFISKADGDRLRASLAAGTPVSVSANGDRLDGDLDNVIIAHEYGHGISSRLTGGAANAACLPNTNGYETMGEGWSDFFGLWMTTKATDTGTTPRTVGTYAANQPTTGRGIRRKVYTTDMAVNDHGYKYIAGPNPVRYAETHDVGEVWAAMLWDLNWAFINRDGFNPDFSASTGGNNKCLQLVIDACKLQPCRPGFVDGRNAILKADSLRYGAANSALIWQVFARRGLGFSANQGLSTSVTDGNVAYDVPAVLSTTQALPQAVLDVFPNPASRELTVRTQVGSSTAVRLELLDVLGRSVLRREVPAARLQQQGETLNVEHLPAGVYLLRVTTSAGEVTRRVSVQP